MKSIIQVSDKMRRQVCIFRYELQDKHSQKRNRVEKIVTNEDNKDNKGKTQEMNTYL